jgi:7,8-dihydropterin-6-yl-methyl-4-(beta-D-ribofuranosyl)aminobenzene 5'-phosphate synthase
MNKNSKIFALLASFLTLAATPSGRVAPGSASSTGAGEPRHYAKSVRVTVLSTMLADAGIGEWGFSALIEVDGRRLLFDTGGRPETVLQNARELGVDLSTVTEVILSHHHGDHTGGLLSLRRELSKTNRTALSRIHVAPGMFLSRRTKDHAGEANPMIDMKGRAEALGTVFVEHREPTEIMPGVWLTGPVPRRHSERNWSAEVNIVTAAGLVPDTLPEDMSLVIRTEKGLIAVTGCGHAGVVNVVDYARDIVGRERIYAVVGGLHLFAAPDETLAWTAQRLHDVGLAYLLGGHCTGIEAVFRIRQLARLDRQSAVVAAVGSSFDSDRGIDALAIAQ